jgi:hypothetical protein
VDAELPRERGTLTGLLSAATGRWRPAEQALENIRVAIREYLGDDGPGGTTVEVKEAEVAV